MMNITEVYQEINGFYHELNISDNGTIFTPGNQRLEKICNIFVVFILFITMMSIGCSMEISKIKDHFLKPKGPIIAMLAQFGIMPLAAFCISKILHLEPLKALVVIVCGCCPGGNLSNLFSLAIEGDVNLSIVLTTFSNLMALPMMPLLLYIYCKSYGGLEKAVPYLGIITALVLTLVPCAIGIVIKHYKPKYSSIVKKVGFSLCATFVVVILILTAIVYKDHILKIVITDLVAVSILLPLTGYTLGYAMSKICKLDSKCSRTISMETGCQNTNLIFAIIKVFFPPEAIGPIIFFPLIFMIMQAFIAFLLILVFKCYKKFKTQTEGNLKIYNTVHVELPKQPGS